MPSFSPTTKTIMIAGSRAWLPPQAPLVQTFLLETLKQIWAEGRNVIVGDNPLGVDYWVHSIANLAWQTIVVYGVEDMPRSPIAVNSVFCEYEQVIVPAGFSALDKLLMRDSVMLDLSDHLLAVWNGSPKSKGTKLSFDNALRDNKRADLATWLDHSLKWTRRNYRV